MTNYFRTIFLSYGVLAFAPHPIPAGLILLATFFYPAIGLMGLAGNVVSNLVAKWMHANDSAWRAGVFGVSGILVGLALGKYAEPSFRMWIFLITGAGISAVISVMLANLMAKYDLPILSLPFMLVIWLILIVLGVIKENPFPYPAISVLRRMDLWLFDSIPFGIFEYIKMFGSILFQENLISGVLVLVAIGLYSRISVLYGLWGGFLGMFTYLFLQGSIDGFHGLNFVLIALAFGGFFVIANRHDFFLTSLAIIAVGLVDAATTKLLSPIGLPSLVFAFNAVTIIFLFPLKMLPQTLQPLRLVPVPLSVIKSPESNLRWFRRWSGQKTRQRTILTLPYSGEWVVLQGNNGEWTHKGIGRYAWDFIVRDERGHQASGFGLKVQDFYAFGLPVLAPAPGTVYAIENNVEDNPPQVATTERNWGNYVIIDHGNGEFSELSHFRQNSIVVVPGQAVQRGDLLGSCGNSGRSPVPHIHFQLQSSPALGAPTLPASFSEGDCNNLIRINFVPEEGDRLSPVEIDGTAEWSLLGRETELWVFTVQRGFLRFSETLQFGTDDIGYPAIRSGNNSLWYIIERPNFIEIRPDFKTSPSLINRSAWMEIVGDGILLPRKLSSGFIWEHGKVSGTKDQWIVETNKRIFHINPKEGIVRVEMPDKPKFRFVLEDRRVRKQ